MSAFDCDVVVIGSGFGGSVCAMRCAEAGRRVVVLERGPRIGDAQLRDLADGNFPLLRRQGTHGIVDLHHPAGLTALTGNAVGGGSHIYTAVTVPAPHEVFATGWPRGISRSMLDPHYARVSQMIAPSPIPLDLARTTALESAGKAMGASCTRLPVAMNWPNHSDGMTAAPTVTGLRQLAATWLRGGSHSRKRTLDQTYLRRAEDLGAEVRPLHAVERIAPREGGGYAVVFENSSDRGRAVPRELSARRVVVAAGALNTLRLLFHCRDTVRTLPFISDRLGERFFTNGDFGALILGPGLGARADSGPPVTAWLDLWHEDRLFLMDTGVWPLGGGLSSISKKLEAAWSFGVMGFDDTPCRVTSTRRGRLRVDRDARLSAGFDARRMTRLRQLAEALGGTLIAPPAWFERRMPVTVHPMGGAVMADSPGGGVADSHGEVFGHRGLFIADASLFPMPTGVAPSMTIAAMAEHVAERVIQTC